MSPWAGEISAGHVSLVDEDDLEVAVELYPPGSLLESPKEVDIAALVSKSSIEMGCFVLAPNRQTRAYTNKYQFKNELWLYKGGKIEKFLVTR